MGLAWITVSDFAKSKAFFKDVLGLILEEETPEHGWMEFVAQDKSFKLGVGMECSSTPMIKAGQNAVVTFTVSDITAAKAELQKHHVTLIGDIIRSLSAKHYTMLKCCNDRGIA